MSEILGKFYPMYTKGKLETSPVDGFVFSIPFEDPEDAKKYEGLGQFIVHYTALEKGLTTYCVSHVETGARIPRTTTICPFQAYRLACLEIGQCATELMDELDDLRLALVANRKPVEKEVSE